MKLRNILSNLKLNTMVYKELEKRDGVKFFSESVKIAPSERADFFTDYLPKKYKAEKVRYRCLFKNGSHDYFVVYLYLTDEEIMALKCLIPLPDKIYFFVEYEEDEFLQVRALGNIQEVKEDKKQEIVDIMKRRLQGNSSDCDVAVMHLEKEDKDDGINSLSQSGKLYSFEPVSFAFAI